MVLEVYAWLHLLFSAIFTKGNNFSYFLCASLEEDKTFPNWIYSLRKEFTQREAPG